MENVWDERCKMQWMSDVPSEKNCFIFLFLFFDINLRFLLFDNNFLYFSG